MKLGIKPIYRIKIIYKSGATHSFWCYSFKIKDGNHEWERVSKQNRPILLGVDEIASVWVTGIFYTIGTVK